MAFARHAHAAATRLGVGVLAVVLVLMHSLSLLHAWQHGPVQVAAVKSLASPQRWVPGVDLTRAAHGGHNHAAHQGDWGHYAGDASCQAWLALAHGADHVAAQPNWPASGPCAPAIGPAWVSSEASPLAWAWARAPPHFL